MKKLVFTTAILINSLILNAQPGKVPTTKDFNKLIWLEGTWARTNTKPGRSGQEYWKKLSGTEWQGLGVTLNGNDTTVVERLKLISKEGSIFYEADVAENKEPVLFKFTEIGPSHFICENPDHDFPKKIEYRREGDKLTAVISGNGKDILYLFVKK